MKKLPKNPMTNLTKKLTLASACLVLLSGCYRMPTEDDYSLVPTTNNPVITRDSGGQLIPGGDF
ncbi:MAG: hypothetical protein VX777_10660 [Chlamydiota bacterium]|nr:hypothetical protein [Chlamydiota bacterium]